MRVRRRADRVLIIVQNLPVPLDRRVWLECTALVADGIGVSVICPKGQGDPGFEELDGVRMYKYPPPSEATGPIGFLVEFVYCWLMTAVLSVRVWWRDGFSVIQACNPPDTYFALARLYRPFGKRFVYDQHDLNPELYLSRFGEPRSLVGRLQLGLVHWLERSTYATADRVICTNESYRAIAMGRGGIAPEATAVVRSGPNTSVMRPVEPRPDLRQGREFLAVYLGIMGPQDGVDLAVRALDVMVREMGRTDCHLALLGFGDCLEKLKRLVNDLRLDQHVTFTGRADRKMISEYLSTADVGLCPDPLSPLNDLSTMNKTMEYMAYALPMVSFDLRETRVSAGHAAVYAEPNDVSMFAKDLVALLDDPDRRATMALEARRRVAAHLDWQPQAERYLGVYRSLLGRPVPSAAESGWPEVDRRQGMSSELLDEWGRRLVDLRSEGLPRFVQGRGAWPDSSPESKAG